jgi:hypothetical protein
MASDACAEATETQAETTGPMTKPLRPKIEMPPSVEISTT